MTKRDEVEGLMGRYRKRQLAEQLDVNVLLLIRMAKDVNVLRDENAQLRGLLGLAL